MSVHTKQSVAYASAARTATPTAYEFNADGHHGLHLTINVTASSATPSVVPTIDFYDAASDSWFNLLTGAAITGVANPPPRLTIYPGIPGVLNVAANDCIHGRMRVVMTHADSDSISYSVGVHLIG